MKETDKTEESAYAWYGKHKNHVDKIVGLTSASYPPSKEDKMNPSVWKPHHWRWFLEGPKEPQSEKMDEAWDIVHVIDELAEAENDHANEKLTTSEWHKKQARIIQFYAQESIQREREAIVNELEGIGYGSLSDDHRNVYGSALYEAISLIKGRNKQ